MNHSPAHPLAHSFNSSISFVFLSQGDVDTNGHVDNMACFLSPGVVAVHCVADAAEDREQHRRSEAAVAYLEAATDAAGRPLRIVRILAPRNLVLTAAECLGLDDEGVGEEGGDEKEAKKKKNKKEGNGGDKTSSNGDGNNHVERRPGDKLPGSYLNFYVCNGAVVVPQFGDAERDAAALTALREHFGGSREVIGFRADYSRLILCGGGNIHCVTAQQPQPLRE